MNSSNNPGARYGSSAHMAFPAPAAAVGAPNPYQSMRGAFPVASATAFVPQQPQPQPPPQQQQQPPAQAASQHHHPQQQQGRVAVEGPYGLLALPGLIQHPPGSENTDSASLIYLTRGFELNSLGINVAQQRPLHPTLVSIALERPEVPVIPEFRVPECYKQAKPRQPTLKLLQKYKDETLMYIFYSMPRDLLQVAAARVLLERGWWFHKVRQQWMRRCSTGGFEFFNQNTWKKVVEENCKPNSAEVEKDLSDPAHMTLSAVIAGSSSNTSNNNNNNSNNASGGASATPSGPVGDASSTTGATLTNSSSGQ